MNDEPSQITGGSVIFEGKGVWALGKPDLQRFRGIGIGIIFQEPSSALNPMFTIGSQVAESIRIHRNLSRREANADAIEWLGRVGLRFPEEIMDRYPPPCGRNAAKGDDRHGSMHRAGTAYRR